jgi:hypothetical protein
MLMRPDSELTAIHTFLAERLADPRIGAALSRMISGQDISAALAFGSSLRVRRPLPDEPPSQHYTPRGRTDIVSLLQSGRGQPLLLLLGRKADRFRVRGHVLGSAGAHGDRG